MESISSISDTSWNIGKQRMNIIRPLAEQRKCSKAEISEAARILELSERYIYRLMRECRNSQGMLTSLIPKKPEGGRGKSRLSALGESVINSVIKDLYLNSQKLKPNFIVEEVRKRCTEKGIDVPSESTVRRRLCNISKNQLKVRQENKASALPLIGCFPKVDYPLSAIQIDHTLVDIILVDPIDRLPIGRPYLTLAIDVYSRCIAGFVLSLDPPSSVAVGLCLTHIATNKDSWLIQQNIDASWPIYGKPKCIYVDNGADFHSAALTRGCEQHGINIEYRPPGQPHYGGIIERVINTLMKLVHTLPGTTFSNTTMRGEYDSDKQACLTLSELERWLTIAITKYYHCKLHTGIRLPPIQQYEDGFSKMNQAGIEFVPIKNAKTFLIDFLPIVHRSLRRDGFMLDHIVYYTDALKPLISDREKHGKFLLRRDPRDLSRIYAYLPEIKGYLEVPYRTLSHPAISLFEHRLAIKRLKEQGKLQVDELALFGAIDEMRRIVKTASTSTRSLRRNRTRIQESQKIQPTNSIQEEQSNFDPNQNSIEAFADIEVWK